MNWNDRLNMIAAWIGIVGSIVLAILAVVVTVIFVVLEAVR